MKSRAFIVLTLAAAIALGLKATSGDFNFFKIDRLADQLSTHVGNVFHGDNRTSSPGGRSVKGSAASSDAPSESPPQWSAPPQENAVSGLQGQSVIPDPSLAAPPPGAQIENFNIRVR